MLPVPPKESLRPKRKQSLYDYAVETFKYGSELLDLKQSQEFDNLEEKEKDIIISEIELIEKLNGFQVDQINSY